MKKLFGLILCITVALGLFACGSNTETIKTNSSPVAECYNGHFVGAKKNNILSFKGIPYAKPPVGELRWKAPQPVEASDETFDATRFGKSAFQLKADSEQASMNPEGQSEDCLTLNVWTANDDKKDKPVMFWIHGGAYSYGGTSDPLYDGYFIVNEHPDVVVVTANYRVGPMGFIDFKGIDGSEEFPTSAYNGILDQIEALKWVQKNIEVFGGNPKNVTIFGESAGGGSVTELLVAKGTEGLFQHAIAESGSVNFTMTHQRYAEIGAADALMKKANAKCMDDLMAISEEELYKIYVDGSDGKAIGTYSGLPLRGVDSIIPEDPYEAILNGAGKDIDLIIGTTADENRYFIDTVCEPSLLNAKKDEVDELTKKKFSLFLEYFARPKVNNLLNKCNDDEKSNVEEFLSMYKDEEELWQRIALVNEYAFRSPAIQVAYNHAKAGGKGKTYMYYFCKKNTNIDWIGACHASEVAYVFHNFEDEQFTGKVVPELADKMCGLWTSFAVDGVPKYDGVEWPEYSTENRETLFFNDDITIEVVNDPFPKLRELIQKVLHYYLPL